MLNITWKNRYLRIDDSRPGGRPITIQYLEAYCRGGSTDQEWDKTVIKHVSRLAACTPQRVELQDELENGVIVNHVITAGDDQVSFDLTATNPTDRDADEVQWAQPCIHLADFIGVKEEIDSEAYLPKCFVFLEGRLTCMPFQPWSRKGVYVPGQAWCPKHVPATDVNPRPTSALRTSNGLIGCYSHDDRRIMATAWEPYQELFQGIFVCLHSDFRIGGLKARESKRIHGAVYVVEADVDKLLKRYEKEFPQHLLQH